MSLSRKYYNKAFQDAASYGTTSLKNGWYIPFFIPFYNNIDNKILVQNNRSIINNVQSHHIKDVFQGVNIT